MPDLSDVLSLTTWLVVIGNVGNYLGRLKETISYRSVKKISFRTIKMRFWTHYTSQILIMAPDLMQSTTPRRRVKMRFSGLSSWINGCGDSLDGIEPRNVMRWSFQSRNRTIELEPLLNARSQRRAFIVHLVGGYCEHEELCWTLKETISRRSV